MINIFLAVVLDFLIGDPYTFPHPVKLMGNIINLEEKLIRKATDSKLGLKLGGLIIAIINIIIGFFIPYILLKYLKSYKTTYIIVNIYLIYTCISARGLHYEGMKVHKAFESGIESARKRVSYIVGRETSKLEEKEIIMATVETVAENTSDGVIAPLLFIMILGAPGGLAYKFVNTMDSMLGYMDKIYIYLGYFPAIIDDIFNWIPARLTGFLMILSSLGKFNIRDGFKIMLRDRKNHKSPNAPYPEGAVAGLLGVKLGGDNYYHGELIEKPSIGNFKRNIAKQDIESTIQIMYRSEILFLVIYLIISKIVFNITM